MPLKRLFAITSLLFFAVLAISPVKNALRPYRAMQRQYRRLGASRARSQAAARAYLARPVAIQQIWLPALNNTVDRCTTCHLGVADPVMAGAPGPFQFHSRTPHTPGDFDRFGCTSCHGGQGMATLQEEAHGAAPGSGGPMIPLPFVEAGCGRCHRAPRSKAPTILSRGRALMATAGCMACHKIKGTEAFHSEAPPLEAEGLKTGAEALRRWLKSPKERGPQRHHAQLPARRRPDPAAVPLPLQPASGAAAGRPGGGRGPRARRQRRERQEDLRRGPLPLLPHRGGQGQRHGPRALQGRLQGHQGLAAGLHPGPPRLQPPHPHAAASASPTPTPGTWSPTSRPSSRTSTRPRRSSIRSG